MPNDINTYQPELEDRAIGALLGLAVGDAVGTTLEFKPPGSFEPITDMVGGGPFNLPAGAWTDDTSMALCLAESLADTGGMDLEDQLRRYVMWRRDGYLSSTGRCFDIGDTTSAQLSRFERTGEAVDPRVNQEAAANGSLMRLAPVAIHWSSPVVAAECSGESSRTTHPAQRPVDACRLLGFVIADLLRRFDNADLGITLDLAREHLDDLHPQVQELIDGSWRDKEPPQIRGTGFCVDALEAALWAVDGATDFRDAILRSANLGDDADTTAIAGQIAGARWGASGIPKDWSDKIVLKDRIVALARTLILAHVRDRPRERGRWIHDAFHPAWWFDGYLLAGEYPWTVGDPVRSRAKLDLLVDTGIRTFVDLTHPSDGMEPYETLLARIAEDRRLDLRRVAHPIPDMGVIDDAGYDDIVATLQAARDRGGVYLHCRDGSGRTSTVVGCYLGGDLDGVRNEQPR